MIEITTPVGRLVGGHPMVINPVIDDKTNLPKMQKDGVTPAVQYYIGLAIPKGAETDWKQTEWGAAIYNEALTAFPNGEHAMPAFSWKITDGDSQVPNKNMNIPANREGYPGHWIINAQNGFAVKSYRLGKYNPMTDQIQRKEEVKKGDYCRLVISVKGNGAAPPLTPGVYMNPMMFELYQAGVEIISENEPDAQATFGATAAALPAGALVDTNVQPPQGAAPPPVGNPAITQAPTPGTVAPAPEFLNPPPGAPAAPAPTPPPAAPADFSVNVNGQVCLASALKAANWSDEQIAGLPRV